ncbi:voltage-gated potassium channel [Aureococcus anophagefferens]|nr:voltage-gated potassium channel [Aureococcus anophagefferens]
MKRLHKRFAKGRLELPVEQRRRDAQIAVVDSGGLAARGGDDRRRTTPKRHATTASRGLYQISSWLDARVGVIHPLAPLKLRWDSCTGFALVLMLCLIITPYQLCFERSNSGPFSPIESLNLAMDMCFLADFLITFQTGIVVQGGVAKTYLKGFATIDLLASVPFTHIFLLIKHNENRSAGRASSLTRL